MVKSVHCPIVTTRLLFEYILLPVIIWLMLIGLVNFFELSLLYKRYAQFGLGVIFYFALLVGYGHGINKFHSPDYSLKFSSLFFAGPFGFWVAYLAILGEPNGYLGLLIVFCAFNSFLYYQNMVLAKNDKYLVANERITKSIEIVNAAFACLNTLAGLYNMIYGDFVFPWELIAA